MEEVINNETFVDCKKGIKSENFNTLTESLLRWSGKQNYSIIFDSDLNGHGQGVLEYTALHKKNLYFISFDNENNVFGGYINKKIINKRSLIKDSNSFVFSLIRSGEVKNKKYDIKKKEDKHAFWLNTNFDNLYIFGYKGSVSDVLCPKIGYKCLWHCGPNVYEYNEEKQPLRNESIYFKTERILVLEMN